MVVVECVDGSGEVCNWEWECVTGSGGEGWGWGSV